MSQSYFKNPASLFCLIFVVLALPVGLFTLWPTIQKQSVPTGFDLLNGTARGHFETAFDEAVPYRDSAIDLWGIVNYSLFHGGRDGVVVGSNGWLFTAEEFAAQPNGQQNLARNLTYIQTAYAALKSKDIKLLIAPIPAKARLYQAETAPYQRPKQKTADYQNFIDRTSTTMSETGAVTDLLAAFQRSQATAPIFLKTDTHWTPQGANVAAQAIAETVRDKNWRSLWPIQSVTLTPQLPEPHRGDLLRYVPLGPLSDQLIAPDNLRGFTVEVESTPTGGDADLFGNATLPVVLVGTSYSANTKWGFTDALKLALQTDVLNVADEGRGPFITMQNYLKSEAFLNNPPKLVVWEIPERFLTFSYNYED